MNSSIAAPQTAISAAIFNPASSMLSFLARKRIIIDARIIVKGMMYRISGEMTISFLLFVNRSFLSQSLENEEDDSDGHIIQGSEIPACSNLKQYGEEYVDNSTCVVESYRNAPQPVEKFNHDLSSSKLTDSSPMYCKGILSFHISLTLSH